jgi:hypothetical protein
MPPARSVLVAGSGRSGTTWIADTLAACKRCTQTFEPWNAEHSVSVPRWGRSCGFPGPYLRPKDQHESWHDFMAMLLKGEISNSWTRQDWRLLRKPFTTLPLAERFAYGIIRKHGVRKARGAEVQIIKDIRANLMLAWAHENFSLPVVFVIRHPCSVVASRLRLGWSDDLGELELQPTLRADFLGRHRDVINGAKSPVERLAVLWCIENIVPIVHGRGRGWLFCNYEEFLTKPVDAFSKLRQHFGLHETRASRAAMARFVSAPDSVPMQLRPWHGALSIQEGQTVLDICRSFGLDFYGEQRTPLTELCDVVDARPEGICSTRCR